METQEMSRRDFVKAAAGTAAAAALVAAGGVSFSAAEAFASTRDGRSLGTAVAKDAMVAGTVYSASVNLYVPAKLNAIIKMNAYLTNLTQPTSMFSSKPTSPVSNNGLVVLNDDGTYTVFVDDFNETFGLLAIQTSTNDGTAATITNSISTSWSVSGDSSISSRIDALKFKIPANTEGSHSFNAKEYANFMNFGHKEWAVTLQVDFDTVKEVSGVSIPTSFDSSVPTF